MKIKPLQLREGFLLEQTCLCEVYVALKYFWRKEIFKIKVFILSMKSVDCKSRCVLSPGNWQQIREDALGVPLWLPHQNAIKLLHYVESQKENTCFHILAAILILPSWPDSFSHDHFFTSGSLQGKSLGPVLPSFSKALEISLFFLLYTVSGTFDFMWFPCFILWCQRFWTEDWNYFLPPVDCRFWWEGCLQVIMGTSKGNRKRWSIHQKKRSADREISICC